MIRVVVYDTSANVFAYHDVDDLDEAVSIARDWIDDGFKVGVIPLVEDVPIIFPDLPRSV